MLHPSDRPYATLNGKTHTMNAKTPIAAALIAFAAASSAFAQEAIPANNWTNSALSSSGTAAAFTSVKSRDEVRAQIVPGVSGSPFADSLPARGSAHRPFTAIATRAEVLADLQVYRESGLEALERGEAVAYQSAEYAAAQAKYTQLRSSPYYATLVQRFASQREGNVNLAAVR